MRLGLPQRCLVTLRTGHGDGAGVPRVEVLPIDELPKGVQGTALAEHRGERHDDGTFKPGARTAQSAGGSSARETTRLARRLTLGDSFADPRFERYARAARAFRKAHVTSLARTVGGGHCGAAPASIIASAALQLAGSRFAFEVLGDMTLGSRLADASRQNLLAAHELCAKEAVARPGESSLARLRREVGVKA
jgi:hypothetical protein